MKIAIFASGAGSNAEAIIKKSKAGILNAEITSIFTNRPDAGVRQIAARENIECKVIKPCDYPDRQIYEIALLKAAQASQADCIALAGYMLILGKQFLAGFAKPILNIHPSLLPAFAGSNGVGDALAYGAKITGVSVHLVTEELDGGPLIIQAALPINCGSDKNEIMQEIHALEHRIYPQALQWLAEGRLKCDGRCVYIEKGDKDLAPIEPNHIVQPPLEKGF